LAYLFVSGIACSKAGLELFKYRTADDYYTAGEAPYSWNPWKLANLIEGYFSLSVWGILFIFQLLSVFGVLSWINMMLWSWSGLLALVVFTVTNIFRFMAYDGAYTEDDQALMDAIMEDSVYAGIADVAFGLTLLAEYSNWMYAQYLGFSEKQQEMVKEEHEMFAF